MNSDFIQLFLLFVLKLIDYTITVVPLFPPLPFSTQYHSSLQQYTPHPTLSSCPWVVCASSWASPFPMLLLNSPCLCCSYQLCFLIPVPFPHFLPSPSQVITLQMISTPMILFLLCLLNFLFVFDSVVDSCEFVAF